MLQAPEGVLRTGEHGILAPIGVASRAPSGHGVSQPSALVAHQLIRDHPVGDPVLGDVADVANRLAADPFRRHDLDVAVPDVGIETLLGGFGAELPDARRAGVVGREGQKSRSWAAISGSEK